MRGGGMGTTVIKQQKQQKFLMRFELAELKTLAGTQVVSGK